MVHIRLGTTLGSESRAREPQSEQTLYICSGFQCRAVGPPPVKSPYTLLLLEVLRSFNQLPQINSYCREWIMLSMGLCKLKKHRAKVVRKLSGAI